MVVSGVHSSVVFNACVYSSMYAYMQSTLSVCIQQYDPIQLAAGHGVTAVLLCVVYVCLLNCT